MFPKTTVVFLIPARGITTFQAQHGQKCSDRACPCQAHAQALSLNEPALPRMIPALMRPGTVANLYHLYHLYHLHHLHHLYSL